MTASADAGRLAAWGDIARGLVVAAVWIGSERFMALRGARLLPPDIARELTLPSFMILVELAAATIGLTAAAVLLRGRRVRHALGITRPRHVGSAVLVTPLMFAVALGLAFQIALPTLLLELQTRGVAAVQAQTGELGRAITQLPIALTLSWAVLVAPVSEELMFRGALYTGLQRALTRVWAPPQIQSEASYIDNGLVYRGWRAALRITRNGGATAIVTGFIFGIMHADLSGGMGLIRTVTASVLGLVTGATRAICGSVLASIAVHAAFNLLSVAATRRWIVSATFPMKRGVPTFTLALGATGLVLLLLLVALRRRRKSLE